MDACLFQAKCGRPLATAGSAGEGSSVRAVKGESALRVGTNYTIGRGSRAVHACEGSEQVPTYYVCTRYSVPEEGPRRRHGDVGGKKDFARA